MFPIYNRSHAVLFFALLLTAVLILFAAAPAAAVPQTRYVDGAAGVDAGDCTDPLAPCKTIGYALGKSFQSDDIRVAQGVYNENLVIENNVNLYGGYDAANWTTRVEYGSAIDGQKLGSVIRYEGGFAGILDGFKITNGRAVQGGGVYIELGSPELQNLWIVANEAFDDGGGVYQDGGKPSIINSKLEHNKTADYGGAIYIGNGRSGGSLSSLTITENEARSGGGLSIHDSGTQTLGGSDLLRNVATSQGGAINIQNVELTIENSTVANNQGNIHGGAMTAEGSGLSIINGLFYGNSTTVGVASVLAMSTTEAYVVNSTIADNAPGGQQAVLIWSGFLHLKNSIMWNNALNTQSDPPCPSCVKVTYSDVQGHVNNPVQDQKNIDADPLFVAAAAGDYRLQKGSPCINAGAANGANPVPPDDITGRPRDSKPDMGAYEYAPPVLPNKVSLPVVFGF